MNRVLLVFSKIGCYFSISLVFIALLFRSTIYWLIPVAKGEPYGFGDVLEFYIAALLLFTVIVTVISGVIYLAIYRKNGFTKQVSTSVIFSVLTIAVYMFLHPLAPKLL